LWEALDGLDPYAAMRVVAHADAELIAYLHARWKEQPRLDDRQVESALADLDAENAAVRNLAFLALARDSSRLVPRLRDELDRRDSPEARYALARLIEHFRRLPDRRARLLLALNGVRAPGASALRRALARE
jgi:hypothetical protein